MTTPRPSISHPSRRLLAIPGALILTTLALPFIAAPLAAENPQDAPVPPSVSRLTIDASQPGKKVSPMLYGVFFEEINRSGDGGLYGELLQNRSFEDSADLPLAWAPVNSGGAESKITLDKTHPLNASNPTALRLEITRAEGENARAGIANQGFKGVPQNPRDNPKSWLPAFEKAQTQPTNGLAVAQGNEYRLSFYARCENGFSGLLTASLEKQNGESLASEKIPGVGADWKKFECRLTPASADADARLIVSASQPGVVFLDMVSLFPKDTFKGRANGLRADLSKMVADLKPAFVRFPGGCFVEGDRIADAFRWKKTIGDIAERPGHWNLWGYRSNDGLGYHEYLQFCEDIGAEPLYVTNVGMAHKDNVPMAEMKEWVQDVLDAVEYANGPADSQWGSLRAKAGHPEPFHLRYMEIGNENGGAVYDERYALFHDALQARYPEIQLITDEWRGLPKSRPVSMIDAHFYGNPEGVRARATQYDNYKRTGPKVYFGEYAVTREAGHGNLQAAVAEAAFMTGLERNSDVVQMCSYAPLFVNPSWRSWNPNAIVFDGARAYGTPSYHVQQMFATNRPDEVLAVKLEQSNPPAPVKQGMMGVGTWQTQAEYKDLKITRGEQVLFDGSTTTPGDWKTTRGKWEIADGVLRQTDNATDVRALTADAKWDDCVYTLKARKTGGNEGFLIIFQSAGGRDKNWWNLGAFGNTASALEGAGFPDEQVPCKIENDRWYDIRVELKGASVKCYLDGKLMHDVIRAGQPALFATAGRKTEGGEMIVKVINASANPQQVDINLQGIEKIAPVASALVLTSEGANDENAFEAPERIAPKEESINNAAPNFRHAFAPHSVTILRLKLERAAAKDQTAANR